MHWQLLRASGGTDRTERSDVVLTEKRCVPFLYFVVLIVVQLTGRGRGDDSVKGATLY
jgi:hypothetical protein